MRAKEITEYGVGRITAQNATADVKPGDEFKNVKKLGLAEKIRKQGNNYVIYSKKGKKLGSYTTKKAAQKRLGQIEYFKHAG